VLKKRAQGSKRLLKGHLHNNIKLNMADQFKNQKDKLISLVKDSILFKMVPEKRSQFENAIISLEYSPKSEKLVEEIIKFFEEERTVIAEVAELSLNQDSH